MPGRQPAIVDRMMNIVRSLIRGPVPSCLVLCLSLSFAACSSNSDSDDDSAGSGAQGGSGATGGSGTGGSGATGSDATCGVSHCETGQHCNNGVCVDGCLSDANCATNQSCADIDADTHIGTCRNDAMTPPKDCQAFCDKAVACGDPEAAMCDQKCAGLSSECVACVNDSNCGAGCDGVCAL